MHFGTKSYLKSTRNHTAKHTHAYARCSFVQIFYLFIYIYIYIYIYIHQASSQDSARWVNIKMKEFFWIILIQKQCEFILYIQKLTCYVSCLKIKIKKKYYTNKNNGVSSSDKQCDDYVTLTRWQKSRIDLCLPRHMGNQN